ncbi:MAG: glycine zipper 2TM domain-containing protein [Beggiatoa sp.]|nr:glycine zipper 2TM domain-containing protein [Beggiatoa sp.]
MKASAWVGTVIAVALMALSATSYADDDGWRKHRLHRHRGHHHRHYYPPPRPMYHPRHHYYHEEDAPYHRHDRYYHEDHAYAPVTYRPYYGGAYSLRGHSSLPILFGGVLGGVLGHELSGGDLLQATIGAIAGGVLGHELDH